jgi:gluconokinase
LLERMEKREGHFMKANMLESQLEALEEPGEGEDDVVVVKLEDETEKQVQSVREELDLW